MDNKRRLYRLIEGYLNEYKKDVVESFYGKGSSIKINRVDFGVTKNYVSIDAKILLGKTISLVISIFLFFLNKSLYKSNINLYFIE